MSTKLTESIDVAQVVLYFFWAFFFGLVYWLRKEDRREGYPLEMNNKQPGQRNIVGAGNFLVPPPKTFTLPHGEGTVNAPNNVADTREIHATRVGTSAGDPLDPIGDPMLAGVGPASYAERSDHPELTREGHDLIIPLRVDDSFGVLAGPDPRGWEVLSTDGKVAGVVKDLWIDRADVMVRYLEIELAEASGATGTRLVPGTMMLLDRTPRQVKVHALRAEHFGHVPTTKSADRITLLEEEKICAFYAGGRMYAERNRLGPVV